MGPRPKPWDPKPGGGASAVVVEPEGIGGPPGGGGGGRSPSSPSSSSMGPGTTAVARLAASRPTTAASDEILGRTIELGGIVGALRASGGGGGAVGGGGIANASAVSPRPVGPAPPTAGIATPYLACILASTSHCDSPLFTPLTSIAGGMYPALPGVTWLLSSCTKDRLHDKSRPSTVVWSRASMHRVAAAADAKDANANPRGRPSSGFSGTLRLSWSRMPRW